MLPLSQGESATATSGGPADGETTNGRCGASVPTASMSQVLPQAARRTLKVTEVTVQSTLHLTRPP